MNFSLIARYASEDSANRSVALPSVKKDSVNDHIILVDRSSVKIESRLGEIDRTKLVNKPKRIKPVLAETERPPPDLVKTTMRIFEGSAKKIKPKGDVAAKVATFKTINDTYKVKSQKKIVASKPPLQPKPFANGSATKAFNSPPAPKISSNKNDGVVTESIVQSVYSVVSKFQQIEKSMTSPEPSLSVKSTTTSPRITQAFNISSPPKKELIRQNSSPVTKATVLPPTTTCSNSKELFRQTSAPEAVEREIPLLLQVAVENQASGSVVQPLSEDQVTTIGEKELEGEKIKRVSGGLTSNEDVDGIAGTTARSISRDALDNIGRAGRTLLYNFVEEPNHPKNYLPSESNNSCVSEEIGKDECVVAEASNEISSLLIDSKVEENACATPEVKSVGAICNLALNNKFPSSEIVAKMSSDSPSPPQKQIGIIRPLVSTKTQLPQKSLSNIELEKNLINRVKSIEQPTKVVVSLKSAEEIQPMNKCSGSTTSGLWDSTPWNQQNNTMVFNFSNRKDVPDYIENDGLIIRRKREKTKVSCTHIIFLCVSIFLNFYSKKIIFIRYFLSISFCLQLFTFQICL